MNRARGFGAIAAIVILVILAVMGAVIVSISTTQQITSAQDVMSSKAWQAARAGNEWGLYQALKGTWTTCALGTSAGLDLTADTGFHVTVYCDSWPYWEGESSPGNAQGIRIYRIKAVACPAATCPATDATAAGLGYVERTRTVLATNQ